MEEDHATDCYRDDLGLLTQADMSFIHSVIGRDLITAEELNGVLNEPKLRQQVIDSPRLMEIMVEKRRQLEVSEYFYYSVFVRQVLLAAGLEDAQYAENIATSMVRMANMQRKALGRSKSSSRYMPVNLQIVREDGQYGSHIRIYSRMDPYEMLLEGFQVNVDAYGASPVQANPSSNA